MAPPKTEETLKMRKREADRRYREKKRLEDLEGWKKRRNEIVKKCRSKPVSQRERRRQNRLARIRVQRYRERKSSLSDRATANEPLDIIELPTVIPTTQQVPSVSEESTPLITRPEHAPMSSPVTAIASTSGLALNSTPSSMPVTTPRSIAARKRELKKKNNTISNLTHQVEETRRQREVLRKCLYRLQQSYQSAGIEEESQSPRKFSETVMLNQELNKTTLQLHRSLVLTLRKNTLLKRTLLNPMKKVKI